MERSSFTATPVAPRWICIALFNLLSDVDGDQPLTLLRPARARKAIQPSPYRDGDGLVTISSGGYSGAQFPTIRFRDYHTWRTSTQRLFTDLAFYQPIIKRVHIAKHQGAELTIGRASDNLFQLLYLPIAPGAANRSGEPHIAKLFLSQESWRGLFAADPGLIGSVTEIAGQPVLIAGVVSQDPGQLPGRVDAWLLEDAQHLARVPANSTGFVLAHLRTSRSLPQLDGWRYMNVRQEDGSAARFDCISLAQRARLPFSIFLFTLIVALITLPATTALPLGEYPRHRGRLPWADRARQWMFLSGKFLLVVPLVSLASVDLAYGVPTLSATAAQYVQLATFVLRISICLSMDFAGSAQTAVRPAFGYSAIPREWDKPRETFWHGMAPS